MRLTRYEKQWQTRQFFISTSKHSDYLPVTGFYFDCVDAAVFKIYNAAEFVQQLFTFAWKQSRVFPS